MKYRKMKFNKILKELDSEEKARALIWLAKFEGSEKRDKVLTIRTTKTCMNRIKKIISFVGKNQNLQISQSDLIERLVEEAWTEVQNSKKRS